MIHSSTKVPARGSVPRFASRFLPALLAGLVLAVPGEAQQQVPPSVLELLPTAGRSLEVGASVEGQLGGVSDYRLVDGRPVQAWEIRGDPGTWVWIDLVSESFDAFLYVVDPERGEILLDDDSGGGCHARIPVMISSFGHVVAVATQIGVRVDGPFTLSASPEEPPVVDEICAYAADFGLDDDWWDFPEELSVAGAIPGVPGEVTGSIGPGAGPEGPMGAALVTWELELEAGQTVQFDLMSDDFDAFLILAALGYEEALVDDDGGEGTNARLTFTAIESGVHQLHVTGYGAEASGSYTLRVTPVVLPGGN